MKKVAVVTSANRGLGLPICLQLVEENYAVHALCRRTSPELAKLPLSVYDAIDLSCSEDIADFALRLKIEKLDLLINNAAIGCG